MGGGMGPQAWGLLVLGVLLTCGNLIHGQPPGSYGEGYTIWCTIGITGPGPLIGTVDACNILRAGFRPGVVGPKCIEITSNNQGYYTLYELAFELLPSDSGFPSLEYLTANFDLAAANRAANGDKVVPQTLKFFDIDECADKNNECSPNAACYNEWATYTCECKDGFRDDSGDGPRGYKCETDEEPSDRPEVDIEIWVYVLIGVAIFVVLMLLLCCCCCYSGSGDCCPGMQGRTKVIRHVKVIPQPMPVPAPPCICKPPEEKKIIIQVDQAPQPAPVQQVMPVEPMVSGPSAFIANSGYDGKIYIANAQAQPVTRALPWADGSSMQTVNPPVQYIQQEQPQYQYIQQEQPQIQYTQQPIYDQPMQPIVYNVNVDPSTYYQ